MKIGKIDIGFGMTLSPMAGITDGVFRAICKEYGCDYTVSEMVSAKALCYEQISKKTPENRILRTAPLCKIKREELPMAIQLFGHEADFMADAGKRLESGEYFGFCGITPSVIDINMGCPMPKIFNNGEGSALMEQPQLAEEIVSRLVKSIHIPVTVKFRLGVRSDNINCVEFAKRMESAGASAICLHARTKVQLYSGKADWTYIKKVKSAVQIPVFGNGDVFTYEDALKMKSETGCDGVAIGRGAEGNPWIFSQIKSALNGDKISIPTRTDKVNMALYHTKQLIDTYGEKTGISEAKKHIAWYLTGERGSASVRNSIMQSVSYMQTEDILLSFLDEENKGTL